MSNIPMVSSATCQHPDGCDGQYFSKGFCRIHYSRLRRTGELGSAERTRTFNITDRTQKCVVEGCSKFQRKVGMCNMHYDRNYRTGDVGSPNTVLFVETAPEGYRTCRNKDCQDPIKEISNFQKKSTKKQKNQPHVSYCRICAKEELVKRLYKLSKEEYRKLLINGTCQICNKTKDLVVDHCHKTNKVRGLLCNNCNRAIGLLGDNIHSLFNAWLYVKENSI